MSIKRWKFHYADEQGYWEPATPMEADYPKHPMEESYISEASPTPPEQAGGKEGG